MPAPADMGYWLGQKYAILGKTAEGEYQRNLADAFRLREEGGQVAPNAASLRALQEAEGYRLRKAGGLEGEQAETERVNRTLGPIGASLLDDFRNGRPLGSSLPGYFQRQQQLSGANVPTAQVPSLLRPPPTSTDLTLDPTKPLLNLKRNPSTQLYGNPQTDGFRRGTANVMSYQTGTADAGSDGPLDTISEDKSPGAYDRMRRLGLIGGMQQPGGLGLGLPGTTPGSPQQQPGQQPGNKGQTLGVSPSLQAIVGNDPVKASMLLNRVWGPPNFNQPLQFGGMHVLPQMGNASQTNLRKGTASVKAPSGKGAKSGKVSKAGGPPKGLEAMLPALMAAMQGGGAPGGPPMPGGAPGGPPMPGGAPGMRKGAANVGKAGGKGGGKSGAGKGGGGLEAMLPALMAASQGPGAGAAGPQAANGMAPAMGFSAAAPPGFQMGAEDVPSGYARGAPSVQPNPNYPFGAGYLFGATAVPGQGSGTVDKVPAMLAPHEAVLNRAAADMLGRGLISQLNAAGSRRMGMR